MFLTIMEYTTMEFVDLGKIVSTHGVRGEVKVLPFTDDFERFKKLKKAYVRQNLPANKRNNKTIHTAEDVASVEVMGCKLLKTTVVLKIAGVVTVEDAEKYRNMVISIDKNDVPELPEDSYYVFDLVGCEIFDADNDNALIGKIQDVIQTGANDVYSVKDTEGDTVLIPAVKDFVKEVDVMKKRIVVSLPTGLLDVYKRNDINDDL